MPSILQASNALHYGAGLAATIFYGSYTIVNLGREKPSKTSSSRLYDRLGGGLILLGYAGEGIVTILQRTGLSKEAPTIHLVLLTTVWSLIWMQRNALQRLILGTSLITLAFEIPLLVFTALGNLDTTLSEARLASQSLRIIPLLFLTIYYLTHR